jgi:hypothetical protein
MYTTDYRSLLKYCIKTHQSISQALERSVINEMKNNPQVGYTWAETVAHLRMIQASIHTLTAMGKAVSILDVDSPVKPGSS